MFKVYCHMSSLIQCYINLYPFNPINNKKKEIYRLRPRARATNQEYTFAKARVFSLFPASLEPTRTSFCSPFHRTGTTSHFILNPLRSYSYSVTIVPSHLVFRCAILFTRLAPQTTRYAQTIKKTQADLPTPWGAGRWVRSLVLPRLWGGY
jgi:hypothetical protein